jgi:hypothetical protein
MPLPRLGDELTQMCLCRSQRKGRTSAVTPCSDHYGQGKQATRPACAWPWRRPDRPRKLRRPTRRRSSNCQDPWIKIVQAASGWGPVAGALDDFAVDEGRPGADQGHEVGALTARQRSWADSMSLNAIASPTAREPGPLVILVRCLTVAKVDSMGLMVRRWTQCSRSRPEARCRSFGRSVSSGRFPNPPCPLLSNGLSTSPVRGSCCWSSRGLPGGWDRCSPVPVSGGTDRSGATSRRVVYENATRRDVGAHVRSPHQEAEGECRDDRRVEGNGGRE